MLGFGPNSDLPQVGDTVAGKYLIVETLGAGAMGVVYRASHLALQRDVAIKVIQPKFASEPPIIERFLREAKAAARLDHPHVVRVLDYDTTIDGRTFLVMERLEGCSLRDELKARGRLPAHVAVGWTLQCARALAAAEHHGIVHRDVKPANIFLVRAENGERVVKLLDFGLTKLTTPNGGEQTSAHAWLGTPAYMSPEQVRTPHLVDHRADIWSLGVVLYQSLSGRLPFAATTHSDMVVSILVDTPPPLAKLVPFPELCGIVHKMLQRSVNERHQHTQEVVRALEALQQHLHVELGPVEDDSTQDTVSEPGRTQPVHSLAAHHRPVRTVGACARLAHPPSWPHTTSRKLRLARWALLLSCAVGLVVLARVLTARDTALDQADPQDDTAAPDARPALGASNSSTAAVSQLPRLRESVMPGVSSAERGATRQSAAVPTATSRELDGKRSPGAPSNERIYRVNPYE